MSEAVPNRNHKSPPRVVQTYLVSTKVPTVGQALNAVKDAVGARIPLVVPGVAVPVKVAGALRGRGVDLVVDVAAVGDALGGAVASAAVRSVLYADGGAVEPGGGAVGRVICR